MSKKQTAVEWLVERLERMIPRTPLYNIDKEQYCKQAKAMEREQIEDAYWEAYWAAGQDVPMTHIRCSEYYEQTYGKEASHEA